MFVLRLIGHAVDVPQPQLGPMTAGACQADARYVTREFGRTHNWRGSLAYCQKLAIEDFPPS